MASEMQVLLASGGQRRLCWSMSGARVRFEERWELTQGEREKVLGYSSFLLGTRKEACVCRVQ
jgi:hypothetical protein